MNYEVEVSNPIPFPLDDHRCLSLRPLRLLCVLCVKYTLTTQLKIFDLIAGREYLLAPTPYPLSPRLDKPLTLSQFVDLTRQLRQIGVRI